MTWFFKRRRPVGRTLRLRSRGDYGDVRRVDFEELAPDVDTFLGQAAYLQLGYFETLSEMIASTPELSQKESLSLAAGTALLKHRELIGVIRGRGADPLELMLPFREPLNPSSQGHTHTHARPQTHDTYGIRRGTLGLLQHGCPGQVLLRDTHFDTQHNTSPTH